MMGHGPGSEWPAQCLPKVLDRMDPTSFMGALASTYGKDSFYFPSVLNPYFPGHSFRHVIYSLCFTNWRFSTYFWKFPYKLLQNKPSDMARARFIPRR